MPVSYEPRAFFRIVFACSGTGAAWKYAIARALLVMPVSVACAVLDHYDFLPQVEFDDLCLPFTFFLGIVTAFRLNDSFKKWERATELMLTLHRHMRNVMSRLCTTLPVRENEEVANECLEIRRLLLLGCCLMKAHVRGETTSALDEAEACGLLQPSERKKLLATATIASGPTGDGKKDKYPTRSRPTFAFQEASYRNHELFKGKHYTCPHTFWGIETSITAMADTFEDAEHLATSLLPIPYAQTARILMLAYLVLMPMAYVARLGFAIVPLSALANSVYFLIDDCSAQMEQPFGNDENDVAIEKTLRRIDKLSASQMCQALPPSRQPVMNYNLFPEARTTDASGMLNPHRSSSMGDSHLLVEPSASKQRPSTTSSSRPSSPAVSTPGGVSTHAAVEVLSPAPQEEEKV